MDIVEIKVPVHVRPSPSSDEHVHWLLEVGVRRLREDEAPVVARFAKHEYRAFDGRLWAKRRRNEAEVYHDEGFALTRTIGEDAKSPMVVKYPFLHESLLLGRRATTRPRQDHDVGKEFDDAEARVHALLEEVMVLDDLVWSPSMGPGVMITPWKNSPAKNVNVQFVPHGYQAKKSEERMSLFSAFDYEAAKEMVEGIGQTLHIVTVEAKVFSREGWACSDASRTYAEAMLRNVLASMVEASRDVPVGVGGREMVALSAEVRRAWELPVEEMLGIARSFLDLWPAKGYADPFRDRLWSTAVRTLEHVDLRPVLEAETLSDFVL